jgi:phenylacetic acid degradation operon negative regulatory protein
LPGDWPGSAARELCGEIYRGLLRQSEQWLDRHATNEDGPLPKPVAELARRFDGL